ncbi:TonB-dependent receptor [Mucilaginibacter daejeonensis]|uniref:TonB-dependent siderophore receptor n=1 Tax=Mucilaginibacter daejeonensis TaxID=398049 RepID=UPI001D1701F6|nr:TonB-dependent siderophore receptor [Mucilaginibacter daejeonensis]UEG54155.1 TonB-dependent receptor [Mucilaginibacter daejeonensis]
MQVKQIMLLGTLCTYALAATANSPQKHLTSNTNAYVRTLHNISDDEQQNGGIRGRITTSDGSVAPKVSVKLKGTRYGTVTNEDGEYHVKKVPEGDYVMVVSAVGLQANEKAVHVVGRKTVIVDFSLTESQAQLAVVEVNSNKNKYKVNRPSNSLRLQSPIIEVPQNIQIVTSQLMADQLVFDVVDGITRNVSGATRLGHWDAQYANIFMRGTNIPAFRNGMNQKMPWGPLADDAATIDRVEFVKGPAGFMMANGEPGGIYNIVTKKPTGMDRSSISLSGGGYNLGRVAADLDGKITKDGRLLYRLNVAAQTKGSYNKYNYTDKYVIAPVISYKIDSNTTVTAEYTTQHVEAQALGTYGFSPKGFADTDPSFFLGDPALDPAKLYDHNVTLYFNHRLGSGWQINAQAAYVRYGLDGGTPWPSTIAPNGDMRRYLNISEELAINKNAQVSIFGDLVTGPVVHRILTGIDMGNLKTWGDFSSVTLNDLQLENNATFNIYNPVYGIPFKNIPFFDRSRSIQNRSGSNVYATNLTYTGAYLQDELRMLEGKLRLTLAGRFTRAITVGKTNLTQLSDNVFSPRVGLSYSILKDLSAYTLYDQAFLPQAGQNWAGEPFKPVRGNNIEFGLKKDWLDGKWNTTFAAYRIIKKNVLTPDLDPAHLRVNPNAQIQLGETRSQGIELDINGEITRNLNLVLNYAYTDAKVTKDNRNILVGRRTPNSVKHITNGWLYYRFRRDGSLLNGFGLNGGYQIQLGRYAGSTAAPLSLPAYYRFDAGASYEKGRITISALVNNLLDRRLLTQGSYTQLSAPTATSVSYYTYIYDMPRNARVTIAYRFK